MLLLNRRYCHAIFDCCIVAGGKKKEKEETPKPETPAMEEDEEKGKKLCALCWSFSCPSKHKVFINVMRMNPLCWDKHKIY